MRQRVPIASNSQRKAGRGRVGRGHAFASVLISSIALLNPPLVSDEPATRDTEMSSIFLPTTSELIPPMNWL
jgi:hypothetical protein